MDKEKQTIIIVGAGVAGLVAARELVPGNNIILVEAQERLGGRIQTITQNGDVVEAGAEFIHGKLKHTMDLLKESGGEIIPIEGKMYRKENGKWVEQEDMIEGWDELLSKMKKQKSDIPMLDFLKKEFGESKYDELRKNAINYTEGFDLADVDKVSVQYLYREWSHLEEKQYRTKTGLEKIIQHLHYTCLESGCRIITNDAVKQIDWEKGQVLVYTASGEKLYGEKCLITIPISILQKNLVGTSINVTPPLDEYITASNKIGVGKVIKVIFQFREAFWQDDAGFFFTDEIFPTWWTQLPEKNGWLTGWCGGSRASRIVDQSDDELIEKALLSLSVIFNIEISKLKDNLLHKAIFNWQKQDSALGAYSYETIESKEAKEQLNNSVDDTLFFSGEALYTGTAPGTVEAAIEHALMTVKKIKKAV